MAKDVINDYTTEIFKILKIEEMTKVLIYICHIFLSKNSDNKSPLTVRAPEHSHDIGATQNITWVYETIFPST